MTAKAIVLENPAESSQIELIPFTEHTAILSSPIKSLALQ